jgi:hypothetical protein
VHSVERSTKIAAEERGGEGEEQQNGAIVIVLCVSRHDGQGD